MDGQVTRAHLAKLVSQTRDQIAAVWLCADNLGMPKELKSAITRAGHNLREAENYLKIMKGMESELGRGQS
jgi:hypothetical protein